MKLNHFKILIILFTVLCFTNAFAVSTAVKTERDYFNLLSKLRQIRIMIENFGNDDLKQQYNNAKILFQNASEDYYAQLFDDSYNKFYKLKKSLLVITENLLKLYIDRAQKILDSTSKNSFDIILKYDKNSTLKNYFVKPYNPVTDIKAYNPEEYHLFFDRETIERYLKNGYRNLQKAKDILTDPDIQYLKSKKYIKSIEFDIILDKYLKAIEICRIAKQYGIEIHKLVNINLLDTIQRKYGLDSNSLDPIYDDRIPEEFKVDANDNLNLIHSLEKKRLDNTLNKKNAK